MMREWSNLCKSKPAKRGRLPYLGMVYDKGVCVSLEPKKARRTIGWPFTSGIATPYQRTRGQSVNPSPRRTVESAGIKDRLLHISLPLTNFKSVVDGS